jgi:hypothetical protein
MAKAKLANVDMKLHAACIIAAAEIIASPNKGLVGQNLSTAERVATVAQEILEAYISKLYPDGKQSQPEA